MNKVFNRITWGLCLWVGFSAQVFAQSSVILHTTESDYAPKVFVGDTNNLDSAPSNWFNLDESLDKVRGVSTEKTYKELLKGRSSKTVVVAVIDSGVDINHEDLKDNIWTNEDEIAGNGVDDDNNGYVDDIHGWNFLGNSSGENLVHDTYEMVREYNRLKEKFEEVDILSLKKKELREFAYFYKLEKDFEEKYGSTQQSFAEIQQFYQIYQRTYEMVGNHLGEKEVNAENVSSISTEDEMLNYAKSFLQYAYEIGLHGQELEETVEYYETQINYHLNPEFDERDIVGDNYANLLEKGYGNGDVKGPDASHGTHVAGIIAAVRDNDLGMKGVADNVKIMAIRAVPDGDERDKDIANAIIYAVDNGAQVVNMSFGKDYSPYKSRVDEAVKYAESKGVLLVHASGNDGKNIDLEDNFPTASYKVSHGKKKAQNWIEVGASSWGKDGMFVADFSNYGNSFVDVFAPGVDLYSTEPDQNYKKNSGTSMAAPVVSGIAALIMSYFPNLSAKEVKDIILQSSVRYNDSVNQPGDNEKEIPFGQLSSTGGIANAYQAIQLALKK